MQDRVSLYPGRVKLVPVPGKENTYDMVRADSPTQEGTPLNKDSLLKDATAALFGLTTDAVPDDVLALIKPMIDSNYAELSSLANSKAKIVAGSYVGTGDNTYKRTLNCGFNPKLVIIVPSDGGFTIGNSELFRTAVLVQGLSTASIYSKKLINVSWPTNGVSFVGQSSESYGAGMNESSCTYLWVAIG